MFDFRIDRCVGNGREITAPAWIIGHLSIGRSNKSVVLVKKAIPNGTLKKLDNIYNKGEKHDQKRRQTVKETIGVGVNEKAALSSDKNCPFVYINFDFTLVNKVASL